MAIKGAIIGDIVGSQFEFEDVKGLDWMNCELFSEKCDFTDDTVMTLAIKSAIDKGVDFQTEMRSVGRRYPLCGYGGRFLEWMFGNDPKPYGSYGNGSAMRVSYIGDYYDDLQEAVEAAKESAIVSHDHPEGIKGAVTIVTCIWMAKHKKTKEEIYQYVLGQYPPKKYKYSGKSIEELKECYVEDISCMSGVPAAARCFYESDSYISFLRNTFRFDNDTDTFGAMFGGVAEEYYGGTGLKDDEILKHYLDHTLTHLLYNDDVIIPYSEEITMAESTKNGCSEERSIEHGQKKELTEEDIRELLSKMDVGVLGIDEKTQGILKKNNICSLEELIGTKYKTIYWLKGLGYDNRKCLEQKMEEVGLYFDRSGEGLAYFPHEAMGRVLKTDLKQVKIDLLIDRIAPKAN